MDWEAPRPMARQMQRQRLVWSVWVWTLSDQWVRKRGRSVNCEAVMTEED